MDYDKLIELALRRGFFFPTAEIYNPIAGFWDYGPVGSALKRKVIELWRKEVVRKNGFVEIDGSATLPESVFSASGHLKNFVDPITECKKCGTVYRADKLIEEYLHEEVNEGTDPELLNKLLKKIKCPKCGGELSEVKKFNMMFKLKVGAKLDEIAYLRPETCQSIFIDFPRVFKVMREKMPLGIAQVGKSFRNEISPRRSIVRMREFTQAEVEIFFIDNADKIIEWGLNIIKNFFDKLGLEYRLRELKEDKPFYSKKSFDLEVKTSLGWLEVVACNHRGNYDLSVHSKGSGKKIEVNGKVPEVFELSMGVDRLIFALLDNYWVEEDGRTVLKLPKFVAPMDIAVFPLVNKSGMPEKAREIYNMLVPHFDVFYDEKGSIGRRYRRQDEIGTPYCITIDGQTIEDETVTLRDRDTMKQERIKISELFDKIYNELHS